MKHLVAKEGFLFVNKDLYMELPEQEALELQEKYNIENGNNNFRN